jgi:8-oxo-dGTP pyrophosphatase MutT (NUDIX family)
MDFISYFKHIELTEDDHLPMLPMGRTRSSEALKTMKSPRESAVGIHCFPCAAGKLSIFLIQRSEYQGKHSGQIAFPGGKMEADDPDLIYTARRECYEEVGIPMHEGEYIRSLSPVYIPVSNFKMTPYFFYHEIQPITTHNEREVQQIIPLGLDALAHHLPIEHRTLEIEVNSLFTREVPGFSHGPHWIWGATALVLQQLRIAYSDYSKQFLELS